MEKIAIGTIVKGSEHPATAIASLAPSGFESWSIMFWEHLGDIDLQAMVETILEAIEVHSPNSFVSSLSVYGNPLRDDETGEATRSAWQSLLEIAPMLSRSVSEAAMIPLASETIPAGQPRQPLVSGFAGRILGKGVEDSLEAWKSCFGPLAERATELGTCLAFENCRLGDTWKTGRWNIAINPDAWDLMFAALPGAPIGLEWEPCHQVEALADPLMQISTWSSRILHIHGKDARIDREVLARSGLYGRRRFHESCFPGNGDTDWAEVFALLEASGYQGTIDIEGWNDASWSGDRELEGQRRSLDYLRARRGQSVGLRVVPD